MHLTNWELSFSPDEKDSNRWFLKVKIADSDLESFIEFLPCTVSESSTLENNDAFNYGMYLFDIKDEDLRSISKILKKNCPQGTIITDKDSKKMETKTQSAEKKPVNEENASTIASKRAFEDMGLNPIYTFEQFVIGPNNRFTAAAAQAVADNLSKIYNPFFIYGGVGLGKTHLMHAVGHYVVKKNPKARVLYVTTEKFMSDVIDSLKNTTLDSMREHYRTVDLLMIDDIQFLEESESTQEEFFHTFNVLHQSNRQIIISSDRPPKQLVTLEDRLRSRFEWGLIADIKSPNLETRVAILKKKGEKEKLQLDDNILLYIASKLKSNIRELEGFLKRINAYASLTHQEVNMDLVRSLMADLLPEEADKQSGGEDTAHSKVYVIKSPQNQPHEPEVRDTAQAVAQANSFDAPTKVPFPPSNETDAVVLIPKSAPPVKKISLQIAPNEPEEPSDGLKPVDVVFFYPEGKEEELKKSKDRFRDVIKKHKLKFKLEGVMEKAYSFSGKVDYNFFPETCKSKNIKISVVIGPSPETQIDSEDFSNILASIMDEQQISLQLVPWADLNKDYRYLNLALDITLLKHRA